MPIETTGASALGGLDRLTVQDDHRRAGQAAAAQARLLMKRPLQFGQDGRLFPGTKVGKRCPGAGTRGVAGATGNRFSQQVKDRVKDGAQVGRAWPPTRPGGRYGAIQAQAASLRSVS